MGENPKARVSSASAQQRAASTSQQLQQQHQASTAAAATASVSTAGGIISGVGAVRASSVGRELQTAASLSEKDARELNEIRNLLWGPNIRGDVFRRWSQGFLFSDVEPSALVQKQGGPCAVIAPVQAYLIKIFIMDTPGNMQLHSLSDEQCRLLLIQALCAILAKCKVSRYRIVTLPLEACAEAKELTVNANESSTQTSRSPRSSPEATTTSTSARIDAATESEFVENVPPEEYHKRLQVLYFNSIAEVEQYYVQHFNVLSAQYGVLLFMYTVLLTKGIEVVNSELLDTSEPLIHNTYGYGSQALINLMLTGRAVAHVWDNDQDVGGLKLRGINEQSDIGFITLMEQMRYCTVGSFFKNPRNPVWVMGSETHLTVLFSDEKRLVSPETRSETARRVFKSYDPDGNNFIPTTELAKVMTELSLVNEPEYVDLMQKRLDPENLGIILLNAFMDEFFPQEQTSMPDTFDLLHYNGIPGSNDGNKVRFYKGSAILLESDLKSMCVSNPMMTCLQTKWPNIEINWHDSRIPSLN